MNTLKNRVQLIGRLGNDPELRTVGNNVNMTKFSIATNEFYTNQEGEKVEETQWHNIVAWGKLAQLAEQLLIKGSEVVIDGKLTHRKFEDKEGVKRHFTEVSANEFYVVGGKKS